MAWRVILLPHDFSPCSVQAERLAIELAEVHGARLLLLHVEETASERDHKAHLDHIAATLRARGLTVETEALVGDLAATILEQAHKLGADVIVMGTRGRTGLERLLMGSVAEDVLRRADVPVVTLRYEDEEALTPMMVPIETA